MTLYSTGCPKCRVLEVKCRQKNLPINIVTDAGTVVEIGKANNILSAPILEADGKYYDFAAAVKLINNIKG